MSPLERFASFCRFEPHTGCVVWIGGTTKGRGHHVDYPSFWFEGRRWFGHRFSAKFIHGLNIEDYHVDHCCPHIPLPNTLCVEHVQATTPRENRELQHERRKRFIHLQVGLIQYQDVYGPDEVVGDIDLTPFFQPPEWLATIQGSTNGSDFCPF